MNEPISIEEYHRLVNHLLNGLGEHLEGVAVVGYHARTGQRIMFRVAKSAAVNDGLNSMLVACTSLPNWPPEENVNHHT